MTKRFNLYGRSKILKTNKKRVLVIDDESSIRAVMGIHLESAGYDAVLSATGKDGIHQAGNDPFDIILCDLKLTDMSGFDVLRDIRMNSKKIPFVVVSGFVHEELINEVMEFGNVHYLRKPFLKKDLLEAISGIIG